MADAKRILVEYRGEWSLGELLCSEPLVRTLRQQHGGHAQIRWRGEPGNAAHCTAFDGPAHDGFAPDRHVILEAADVLPLARYAELAALPSLPGHMAAYAGLSPIDHQPRLLLGPDELWFEQELGIWRLPRPIVAVCADGAEPWDVWPRDRLRELAGTVLEHGGTIVELGCEHRLGLGADFVGKLSIRQSAAILSGCDLYLGNAGDLLHYAQAADVPAIAFFGREFPERHVHDDRLVIPIELEELSCIHCLTDDFAGWHHDGCRAEPEAACMRELPLELAKAIVDGFFEEYLSDCPRRGHEGARARAFRSRIYAERAAKLLTRGHAERAGSFLHFAQDRLPLERI